MLPPPKHTHTHTHTHSHTRLGKYTFSLQMDTNCPTVSKRDLTNMRERRQMWGKGKRRKRESQIRVRPGENRLGREGEPGWPSSDQHGQSHHGKLAPGLERTPWILTRYYTDVYRHAVKAWQRLTPHCRKCPAEPRLLGLLHKGFSVIDCFLVGFFPFIIWGKTVGLGKQ